MRRLALLAAVALIVLGLPLIASASSDAFVSGGGAVLLSEPEVTAAFGFRVQPGDPPTGHASVRLTGDVDLTFRSDRFKSVNIQDGEITFFSRGAIPGYDCTPPEGGAWPFCSLEVWAIDGGAGTPDEFGVALRDGQGGLIFEHESQQIDRGSIRVHG